MPQESIEDVDFTHPRNAELAGVIRNRVRDTVTRIQILERAPALVVAMALCQVAREYLNRYPEKQRALIVDQVIAPFLLNEREESVEDQPRVTLR